MHEVNLTSDPETMPPRPFQFPSIDGCFRPQLQKQLQMHQASLSHPRGAGATTGRTSADLPIPGQPSTSAAGSRAEPV
jgi:hypothetical protein